jgi:osomolarity two-component system response regulator SSK1
MQALIDFDGWRKWKDFATANGLKDPKDKSTGPGGSKAFGKKPSKPAASTLNSTAASTTENKDFAAPLKKEEMGLLHQKIQEESEESGKETPLKSMPTGLDGAGGALKKEDNHDTGLKLDTGS